LVEVSRV